jgi:hypothetical protein
VIDQDVPGARCERLRRPNVFLETVDLLQVIGDLFSRLTPSFGDENTSAMFLSLEGRFLTIGPELAWLVTILDYCSE